METAVAWTSAIERHDGPSALMLSRQNLPQVSGAIDPTTIAKGGYVLSDCDGTPEAVLIATGSEVMLAMEAQQALKAQGRQVRVVSMPCTSVFDDQSAEYKESVLPSSCTKRVAMEAGVSDIWYKYASKVIGVDRFGFSAPGDIVMAELGMTADNLAKEIAAMN
jgi:transketolase